MDTLRNEYHKTLWHAGVCGVALILVIVGLIRLWRNEGEILGLIDCVVACLAAHLSEYTLRAPD